MRTLLDELRERADKEHKDAQTEYNETFNFNEVGDELFGILRKVREHVGTYDQKVYTVETLPTDPTVPTPDTPVLVDVFGTHVLDDKLNGVAIGSTILVRYLGIVKGQYAYHNYAVAVKEP